MTLTKTTPETITENFAVSAKNTNVCMDSFDTNSAITVTLQIFYQTSSALTGTSYVEFYASPIDDVYQATMNQDHRVELKKSGHVYVVPKLSRYMFFGIYNDDPSAQITQVKVTMQKQVTAI